MNHLPKLTTVCPCHHVQMLFEERPINGMSLRVKNPATKNSGNKEYYRARCSVGSKNYTVEA